ncbi:MAG: polysaccharide deacetylase family protein [Actinobacteria bacterium]|nr:polysaccharide deacetylase family protein [Actinomycetota bacterium]
MNIFFAFLRCLRLSVLCLLFTALLFYSGEFPRALAAGPPGAEKVPVIAYHEVLPSPGNGDSSNSSIISLEQFTGQMNYLHSNGFYTASLAELEGYVKSGRRLPPKTVVITFDDGYESSYLYCYPYLLRYNFRASVFLMGSVPPNARQHLTGLQLLNMTRSGLVEIGSHTYGLHREIDGTPALMALSGQEIAGDFARFNLLCSRVGINRPFSIAYPYGAAGPAALEASSGAGYRMGFTIEKGYVRTGDQPTSLKRFNIGPEVDIDSFAAIVSGTFK